MDYKILAKVKFNDGYAIVLDKKPKLIYKKVGDIIYGTDGLFYSCYKHGIEFGEAFAGRKFEIKLDSGEIIKCNGQWWDAGQHEVSKIVGRTIRSATVGIIDELKKCYVFCGYDVDIVKYDEFVKEYNGLIYGYKDYKKIIKHDEMWNKMFRLQKDKRNLIEEIKKNIKNKIL